VNEPYLWEKSGDPDAELQQLENILAPLRLKEQKPDFAALQRASFMSKLRANLRPDFGSALALAATIALAVWLISFLRPTSASWEASATTGEPKLGGKPLQRGRFAPGTWLITGPDSTAQIQSAKIGEIEVGSDSQVSLKESSPQRQLLAMRYGNLHARVFSPPGLFIVDTPSARAIDLGCEYTLKIERDGHGELHVLTGWVSLNGESQSLVPAGAMARVAAGGTLSPPYFSDATPAFQQAAGDFAFLPADSAPKHAALETLLREARQRDALTLLNLFSRANESERLEVFDKLNQLVPAPEGITRETARNWHTNAMNEWWPVVQESLQLGEIKKTKGDPRKP
jgi:ferric-dicitrate binding protein FerR (iron transport regulator)